MKTAQLPPALVNQQRAVSSDRKSKIQLQV